MAEVWLEDIVQMLQYRPASWCCRIQHVLTLRTDAVPRPTHRNRGRKRDTAEDTNEAELLQQDLELLATVLVLSDAPSRDNQGQSGKFTDKTLEGMAMMDYSRVDIELTTRLVHHISTTMDDGAILIFMPGWDDISKLHDKLVVHKVQP